MSRKSRSRKNSLPRMSATEAPEPARDSSRAGGGTNASSAGRKTYQQTRLNKRFLLATLAIITCLAVGIHFAHGYAVRQNADQLLHRAWQADNAGKVNDAIRWYTQYLQLKGFEDETQPAETPGEDAEKVNGPQTVTDIMERVADLLYRGGGEEEAGARLVQAYRTYEEVLARDPDRVSARRSAVAIALQLPRYRDALTHLESLLPADGNPATADDATTAWLISQCHLQMGDARDHLNDAQRNLLNSIAWNPSSRHSYMMLAGLWMQHPEVMDLDAARQVDALRPRLDFPMGDEVAAVADAEVEAAYRIIDAMVEEATPRDRCLLDRAQFLVQFAPLREREGTSLADARQQADAVFASAGTAQDAGLSAARRISLGLPRFSDLNHDGTISHTELTERIRRGDGYGRLIEARHAALSAADAQTSNGESVEPDGLWLAITLNRGLAKLIELDSMPNPGLVNGSDAGHEPPIEADAHAFLAEARRLAELGRAEFQDPRFHLSAAELELQKLNMLERMSSEQQLEHLQLAEESLEDGIVMSSQIAASEEGAPEFVPIDPWNPEFGNETASLPGLRFDLHYLYVLVRLTKHSLEDGVQLVSAEADATLLPASEAMEELEALPQARIVQARERIGLLKARQLLVTGNAHAALAEAQRLQLAIRPESRLRDDCIALLAACFDQLGRPEAKLELYRAALQETPESLPWQLGQAAALAEMNRLDDALAAYYNAIAVHEGLGGVPLIVESVATLHLRKQSRELIERRDWKPVEALLGLDPSRRAETLSSAPDSHEAAVLLAETLRMQAAARWARGESANDPAEKNAASVLLDEAEQVLTALRDSRPNDPRAWGVLGAFAGSRFDADPAARLSAAQAILNEAGQRFPDSLELRISAIGVALGQPPDVAVELIVQLSTDVESVRIEDRFELLLALARGHATLGNWEAAMDAWNSAGLLHPNDHRPHVATLLLLLEAAADDPESGVDATAWTDHFRELVRIESGVDVSADSEGELQFDPGQVGPFAAICLAHRLLHDVEIDAEVLGDTARLSTMRRVLQAADRQRPSWALIPRLRGQIEALFGEQGFALIYFEEAFRRGDRSAEVISPLIAEYQTKVNSTHRITRDAAASMLATLMAAVRQDNPALMYGNVGRLAQRALFDQGDLERAIGIAEQLYETTQQPQDKLALAYTRAETIIREEQDPQERERKLAAVEEQFREITRDHPEWPNGWLALVQFLTNLNHIAEAEAAAQEAAGALPAEPAHVIPLTLARCHQTLTLARELTVEQWQAYLDLATNEYEQALAAAPDDASVMYSAALFYLGSQRPQQAIALADQLLSQATTASDAEQSRALIVKALGLATTGIPSDVAAALTLLREAAPKDAVWQVHVWRTLAALLDQRNHPDDAEELIEVLEKIVASEQATSRERFTLAGLHDRLQQNWPLARSEYEELLRDLPQNRLLLAVLIDGIVRHNPSDRELTEARNYLDDLQILEPDSYRTVVLESKVMAASGDGEGAGERLVSFVHRRLSELPAEDLLEQLSDNQVMEVMANLTQVAEQQQDDETLAILDRIRGQMSQGQREEATAELRQLAQAQWLVGEVRTEMLRSAATLLEGFEQLSVAESLYREYVQASRRADAPLALARFFGRQERFDDAIDICLQHWDEIVPETVATTSVGLLRIGRLPAARIAEVSGRIEAAIATADETAARLELLRLLADVYDLQQRYDDAREVYLQMLLLDENHIVALNNLAWILACRGDPVSGLELINRAIERAGPYPELLDTQGVALMHAGQSEAAVQVLMDAARQSRSASVLLHLADARRAAGDMAGAEAAFQEYREMDKGGDALHPLDQKVHQRLESLFPAG